MNEYNYFKSIINTWNTIKHTPKVNKEMKEVLRQFDRVKDELLPDEQLYLKPIFQKIYKEVYKQ